MERPIVGQRFAPTPIASRLWRAGGLRRAGRLGRARWLTRARWLRRARRAVVRVGPVVGVGSGIRVAVGARVVDGTGVAVGGLGVFDGSGPCSSSSESWARACRCPQRPWASPRSDEASPSYVPVPLLQSVRGSGSAPASEAGRVGVARPVDVALGSRVRVGVGDGSGDTRGPPRSDPRRASRNRV